MKEDIKKIINQIYDELKKTNTGNVANYIPQLANVDPNKLAVSVCFVNGEDYNIGDFKDSFCLFEIVYILVEGNIINMFSFSCISKL